MPAIISDQFRILNARNFVAGISGGTDNYYTFLGFSNYQDVEQGYGTADWNTNTPAPKDGFKESNDVWDTMLGMKKMSADDIRFKRSSLYFLYYLRPLLLQNLHQLHCHLFFLRYLFCHH